MSLQSMIWAHASLLREQVIACCIDGKCFIAIYFQYPFIRALLLCVHYDYYTSNFVTKLRFNSVICAPCRLFAKP